VQVMGLAELVANAIVPKPKGNGQGK